MRTMKILFVMAMLIVSTQAGYGQNIERMFTSDVWVYLYQFGVPPNGPDDNFVRPVQRTVPTDFELRDSLEAVFEPRVPADEDARGFAPPAHGLIFKGVTLRNGVATIRFSQPADLSDVASLGPEVFVEAVTKTARQFRFVKSVKICAIGKTRIDSELPRPFPRCPAKR